MNRITIEISPGEFLDRLAILCVKRDRMGQVAALLKEIDALECHLDRSLQECAWLHELMALHRQMWDINEQRKHLAAARLFTKRYLELTVLESEWNNQRWRIKNRINQHCGSELRELKSAVCQ